MSLRSLFLELNDKIEKLESRLIGIEKTIEKLKKEVESHKPRVYGPMPNSRFDRAINKW